MLDAERDEADDARAGPGCKGAKDLRDAEGVRAGLAVARAGDGGATGGEGKAKEAEGTVRAPSELRVAGSIEDVDSREDGVGRIG